MVRLAHPPAEPPVAGESSAERYRRTRRNRKAHAAWLAAAYERCGRCGFAALNVRHNVNKEDQLEGPAYYQDMADAHELHEFEPTGERVP